MPYLADGTFPYATKMGWCWGIDVPYLSLLLPIGADVIDDCVWDMDILVWLFISCSHEIGACITSEIHTVSSKGLESIEGKFE